MLKNGSQSSECFFIQLRPEPRSESGPGEEPEQNPDPGSGWDQRLGTVGLWCVHPVVVMQVVLWRGQYVFDSVFLSTSVSLWVSSWLWGTVWRLLQPEGRLQTQFLPPERQLHHRGTASNRVGPSAFFTWVWPECSPDVLLLCPSRCTCLQGYVGNGKQCFGNILERLNELNTEPRGRWTGQLSRAISLFGNVVPVQKHWASSGSRCFQSRMLN